ncbi:hypothetical protein [Amycolatopsis dendrobii]|uniref:Uncharacterized protein n=1 Tax=Amycolatopsis dendrobii TaxID=2760662 RepID=A0A7W3Z9L7_9PSEU|nr:hypothetical protein [Amycolatopsis dendrobii]MBB1153521.1 hypothetical protein [Amycolatopsis dendrobii]
MKTFAERLVSPDGREFTARSPAEYNALRYGQGYRPADEPAPDAPAKPTAKTAKSVPAPPESAQDKTP